MTEQIWHSRILHNPFLAAYQTEHSLGNYLIRSRIFKRNSYYIVVLKQIIKSRYAPY